VAFSSILTGTLHITMGLGFRSITCKGLHGRSKVINSITHSITIQLEKLGKRQVSRPICSCGWAARWAYITDKFARDAGQEHIKQVLAQMQTVKG
jgi:hypothetical protein